MSARSTRLVIEREVRESARRKGVWALVILTFLGATALALAPNLFDGDDTEQVMIVGPDGIGLARAFESVEQPTLEVSSGVDRDEATTAIAEGDVDVAVVLGPEPVLLVEDVDSQLARTVADVVADRVATTRLTEAGIDPERVRDAFAGAVPVIEPIDVEREGREASAFGITLVLYILTVVLTSQVAGGVAVEKSNRVSEVLLAIVPPRSLLFGKVVGVGCIGLVTLLAGVTPVVIRLLAGGDLPAGLGRTLAASAAWFIGGLALYLILAGALGAMVARQEEAGAVVVPLTMFLVVGYIIAISAADTRLGAVLAYVPLLSPMIEPYRIAIGAGSPVEYVLSALLLMLAVVVVARVGAVVFRRAIVQTGRRLRFRDLRNPA
ncbi:ABC transporter permease [Ilumatobacter sp.]|uniref:ABC transporter permease n=1 Tax=Ilumatobacter sp. TaxID=1967498 RepID=UPI003AF79154